MSIVRGRWVELSGSREQPQKSLLNCFKIITCFRVGAGLSHSLFIARNQTEADKKILEKFPVIDQAALD